MTEQSSPKKNNLNFLAVISIILSIPAIFFDCLNNPIGLGIGIIGLVLAILSLKPRGSADPAKKGLAVTAIVMSCIGILFSLVVYFVLNPLFHKLVVYLVSKSTGIPLNSSD